MNKAHKTRRAEAAKAYSKGQNNLVFKFGNFTQTLEIGKIARKSKRPKVAGQNFKEEKQTDGETVATY